MDRAERIGFGVAALGHVLLFGALSLGLLSTSKPKPPLTDPIDVQLVDLIGMRSAAPAPAADPAPSEAPDEGAPEEAAPPPDAVPGPPEPAPTPPPPTPPPPTPAPPKPAPPKPEPPKPAPPKPAPPKPTPKPKPAPPKPAPKPKPEPKVQPKPKPAEPARNDAAEKAKAAKAAAAKAAAAKAAADKAAAAKAAASKAAAEKAAASKAAAAKAGAGEKEKTRGSRLGPDFLKGISPEKSTGKAQTPKAVAVSARAMAGLVAAIAAQVRPCYNPPAGGASSSQIVTQLSIRMKPDGSVASVSAGQQSGVTGANQAYAAQMADAAKRAVLRCSPLKLPAELYDGGWDDFDFRFRPEQMQ